MNFYSNVRQYGNKLLVRAVEGGERVKYKEEYSPYLFVQSNNSPGETDYETIHGQPVIKKDFDTIKDAKDFSKQFEDVHGFQIYGMNEFIYPYMNDNWPGELQYSIEMLQVVSIDIETKSDDGFPDIETANKEITVLTMGFTENGKKKYLVIGIGKFVPHQDNVTYIDCADENALLKTFLHWWQILSPDIVTGWNTEFFDIPYLYNRITRLLGEPWAKKLSPWGIVFEKQVPAMNGETRQTYDIYGVAALDYLAVYKKFTYNVQESYKLDHIAMVELGVQKLDYSEYDTIHEFYEKDYQKFVEYNVRDTELIDMMEDKLRLLELALAIAFDAKINFVDALTSVKMWDVIIHNYLMEKKIVVPQKPGTPDYSSIVGGYVKDPYVDQHHWVVSFDLNSLYPHLIMQYNISPENFIEKLEEPGCSVDAVLDGSFNGHYFKDYMEENNAAITPNGCAWRRDKQGFLPALMEKMYLDRKSFKKKMLAEKQKYEDTHDDIHDRNATRFDKIQMAKKIQLNSAYGALANKYFRWFNADHAESITMGGQLSIRWIERKINAYLNKLLKTDDYDYVIASDTDSIYLRLDKLVTKQFGEEYDTQEVVAWLDNACQKAFEPYIDKSYQELADYVNAFDQKMQMKREAIAEKGVWTGKKRYILNVWNNEGVAYETPKLKYMGIEAVRSSTPSSCRDSIKDALSIIMNGSEDELMTFVANFKDKFRQMPFESVAFPRGLNGLIKYQDKTNGWKKGTPVQVRGALLFNLLVKERKLTNRLELLKDGDKIKFCYLRMPNPTRENVITFSDGIPHGFEDVEPFIDYTSQFEKAFLGPLRSITDVIGWELEQKSTLDGLFV